MADYSQLYYTNQTPMQERGSLDLFASNAGNDRRLATRWPIQLAVTCRTVGKHSGSVEFSAETINMSSTGVLLTTPYRLRIGARLHLDITWPVLFDDRRPLKL